MKFTDPTGMFEAKATNPGREVINDDSGTGLGDFQVDDQSDDHGKSSDFETIEAAAASLQTDGDGKSSGGGLQTMAKAGLFDFDVSDVTSGDVGNTIGALSYVAGALGNKTGEILSDRAGWGKQYSNSRAYVKMGSRGFDVTTKTLSKAATAMNVGSKVLGGVGLFMTGYQLGTGQISGTEALVDAAFGVIGFMGPVGAGVSILYFGSKAIYEYSTGETWFEKPVPLQFNSGH